MKELDKDYEPFKKGNLWADAHVDEAAQFMKKLYEDKEFYNKIAVNGQNYAKEHLAYKLRQILLVIESEKYTECLTKRYIKTIMGWICA